MRYVSTLDAQTEGALKVIAYYDALVEHGATLEACVRASASLGLCIAGLHDQQSSWSIRYDRTGSAVRGQPEPSIRSVVRVGAKVVGEVWLERSGPLEALDELVVERFALAAAALWKTPRPGRSVGTVLESIFSGSTDPNSRDRALEHWGFCIDRPLDVAAVATDDVGMLVESSALVAEAMAGETRPKGRGVVWAALGNIATVVVQAMGGAKFAQLPTLKAMGPRTRVGLAHVSEISKLPDGWRQAQAALRFADVLGFGAVVDYRELGCLTLLGELSPQIVHDNAEIRTLSQAAKDARGHELIETLEMVLTHDSIRQAAAAMYMHPTSLHYRVEQIEKLLGFSLKEPHGKFRGALAIALWRLSTR